MDHRDHVQGSVGGQTHHHNVEEGPQSRTLTEWNPREKHDGADHVDHPADLDAEMSRDALTEDIPRVKPVASANEEPQTRAEAHEAEIQPHQPIDQTRASRRSLHAVS